MRYKVIPYYKEHKRYYKGDYDNITHTVDIVKGHVIVKKFLWFTIDKMVLDTIFINALEEAEKKCSMLNSGRYIESGNYLFKIKL